MSAPTRRVDLGEGEGASADDALARLWRRCADASAGFEHQALVPAPELRSRIDDAAVTAVLADALADPGVRRMLKVTVDGAQSTVATERAIASPPRPGETTREWTRRLFGDARVGVGLNGAQRWSAPLADLFAAMAAPLWDVVEHGWVELRVTLFLGDYGFTDGGAHRDLGHPERVVHLNLGPGAKVFHTWRPDDFAAVADGAQSRRLPPFPLESARTDVIEPFHLFVLNVSDVHVADNDQHSVSVAVEMIRRTPAEVLAEAIGGLAGGAARSACDPFLPGAGEGAAIRALLGDPDLGARLTREVETLAARTRSNGGFRSPPRRRTGEVPQHGRVRRHPTYPLVLGAEGELYARGTVVRLPGSEPHLAAVAAALGAGGWRTVSALASAAGVAPALADHLVDALWRVGAVQSEPIAASDLRPPSDPASLLESDGGAS